MFLIFTCLVAIFGAPGANAAQTEVHFAANIVFSLDPICFNDPFDQNVVTVAPGTTLYACVNFADKYDPTPGPATNVVTIGDLPLSPTAPQTIAKGSSFTWISPPFVATQSTTYTFTTSGKSPDGTITYIGGPDRGTVYVSTSPPPTGPAIALQKTVSTNGKCPGTELVTVLSGTPVTFCYQVTNIGSVALNNISVSDFGITMFSGGSLNPGQSIFGPKTYAVYADSSTSAVVQGTYLATGQVVKAYDPATVDVVAPQLSVATTISTNGQCPGQEIVNVLAGTNLTWCYAVTNNGDTTVSGVTVSDDHFGAVPGSPATLAPSQSVTFTRPDVSTVDMSLTAQASGTVTATGGAVKSNFDPAAVNVVGPRIDIDVTVSTNGTCPGADTATVAGGTNVVYCYKVSNIGDDTLSDIDVVNDNNVQIGTIASLVPGASQMIVGGPTLISADTSENATATGTDPYGFGVTAADLAKVHALLPSLTVQKTVSLDGTCPGVELVTVVAGSPVTYCYAVTNNGGTALHNVVVDDNGATVPVGDLAVGQTASVSSPYVANADSSTTAIASGVNAPTGAPVSSGPDGATVEVVTPSLTIEKTASSTGLCPGSELVTVTSGTPVVYCYVVTNNGDTPVSNVVVVDDGFTISVGDLGAGQAGSAGANLVATSNLDTPAVATGTLPATGGTVSSPPNDAAVVIIHPALAIEKTVSTSGACPGSELVTVLSGSPVTYCYAVTNTGDTAVSNISILDNGATITVGDLAPGQSGTGTRGIVANADETTPAIATGYVTATGAPVDSPYDSASVDVVSPALSIQKTVSTDGTCPGSELVTVLANTAVTYCYTVTNTGDTTIGGVTVTDGGVTVTIGDLAPGQTGTGSTVVNATGDVNTPAVASGTTVATGTSVSSGPDGAAIDVVAPSLTIAKTVSTSGTCPGVESVSVLQGATVTYCYSVTNNGDTAVNGVTVTDAGVTVTIGDLAPGASGSGSSAVVANVDTNTSATATGTVPATGTSVTSPPDGAAVDVVHPALVIEKTVSTSGSCPGTELVTVLGNTQVTYCYQVTNTGDTLVTGVTVTDNGTTVAIGDLAPGASGSGATTITALGDTNTPATANGTTAATGTPVASPPDGAAVDVVTPVLAIATTVSKDGQCPGQEVVNVLAGTAVTWCYTVTNTGDTAVAGITVTDSQYGVVPGAPFGLAPGQSQTLSLNVSANVDVTLTASASGTAPATGTPVVSPQDPAVVNVVSPNIDIDVTVSTNGQCPGVDSASVPAGTSVLYCYKVTNNGDDTLSDVLVTDGAGNVIADLSDLAAGTSVSLESSSVLVQGDQNVAATASGTDAYGFPVTDSDTALVHALYAKLAIQKTVSLDGKCPGVELVTVLANTAATYCYLVTNTGDTAVVNVSVDDAGHPVTVGNLTPGQSVVVTRAVTATTDEDTFAAAIGTNPATNQPVASAQDDAVIDVVHPSLAIDKTVSLNGTCPGTNSVTVLPNTPATYCYAVTNTGDTTVGDILVTDDSGASLPVGTLAAGATTTISAPVAVGSVDLDTFAKASGTDTATWTKVTSGQDDALIDVIHPALSIATTVSTDGQCPGQEVVNVLAGTGVTWCYVVKNTGDVPVSGVVTTDDQYGAVPGGSVSLAPGASVTLSRSVVESADVTATAVASGTDGVLGTPVVSNQDPAVVNVVSPSIDLDVTVSTSGQCPGVDSVTVPAGTGVTYCYTVANLGDDTLTNVVVKDGSGNTLTTIATLAAGASSTFASAPVTEMANVTVAGTASAVDQYGYPVSDADTAVVQVVFANLHIVKTAPAQVNVNSALAYTLAVSNIGQATAVSPVVTDALPAGTTYVSATTTSGTCSYANGTVTCALPNLAPGASATITVNVNVTATGSITNTAVVTSSTPDSDPSDNSSSATTQVVGSGGATRTLGFYSNHPTFTQNCLNSLGGSMNIGWFTMRDEKYDNEIDGINGPDADTRKETGISMVMGILNANVDHYTNNKKRPALEQAKMQAAKQLVTAICNWKYLGTSPSFDINGMLAAMSGTNSALILSYSNQADAFNNSGDAVSTPQNPGPANSKYPWDDPTDPND